jgi:hypothetical protein
MHAATFNEQSSAQHLNGSTWLYVFAWAATLVDQFLHLPMAGDAAGIAILGFLLLEFGRQRRYAQILFLALCGIGLVGVVSSAAPLTLFLSAWRRGAGYAAFFLALSSLRDAAETSPLIRRCGQHLVAQPPGRRYAALTAGGHLFGIILSYGAIELLGAMVMRANTLEAAGGSADVRAIRSRRMLMAIYRGFCVMNCWSPLNLMTAVVSTAVPAAPMRILLPAAFLVSLLMTALGWLEDRLTAPPRLAVAARLPADERWSIHLRVIGLVLLVMLLAEGGSIVLGISLVAVITLVVPMVGFTWVLVQSRRFVARGSFAAALPRVLGVLRRRSGRFLLRVPAFRGEATVLAGSGFMAVAVAGVLPAAALAPLIGDLPPLAVPLLVPVLLIATGQLGLNPVAVIALLGAAMPNPAVFGVPPAVLAFSCMLGWGLAVNMTPMSASAITTARWAGVSPWTVSTVWNAGYTASALVLAWLAIAVAFTLGPSNFTLG